MRKVITVILTLIIATCFVLPVCADTGVKSMNATAVVSSDGGCDITITATIRLEEAIADLKFPIPADATAVTLNGSRVSTSKGEQVRNVDLSKVAGNIVGEIPFTIQYSLYDVIVVKENGLLEMQIPLLSGFAYPVESLECFITMPGIVDTLPGFVSGYYQAGIEKYLTYQVDGSTISVSSLGKLNDREVLTMTLAVSEKMFPRTIIHTHDYDWAITAMAIVMLVAAAIYVLGMWNPPGFARTQPEPPQGYDAGSLGTVMAGSGLDLTMMIFTWAQLGYIFIEVKGKRVVLHKRMDMGNERSDVEIRWFRKLFGKSSRVNTTDLRYAELCRAAAKKAEGTEDLMRRFNLDRRLFRGVASLTGLFGGMAIAVALASGAALQGLLMVIFGAVGLYSAWYMQDFGRGFLLQNQRLLKRSIILSGVWLVLGLICGAVDIAILTVGFLLIAGVLLAWGGRRTPMGRLIQMQTRGFVRYLKKVKPAELQRLHRLDPDYFFRMAPYTLALGQEKRLARKLEDLRLDRCLYLSTGIDGRMTALQWAALMRRTADAMNDRANRLPMEKLIGIISNLRK